MVERLAGPRRERGRDTEQRAVRVLEDEGRRGGVPRRVAAGLEGGPDAAGRERGRIRLALDQLLAGELGDRRAVAGRAVEGVVLLRGRAGQRLEPVREVGRALLHRPLLHRGGDGVGEDRVEREALVEGLLQALEDLGRDALALDRGREDVGPEDLVGGYRQVGCAQRAPIGAPLRGGDVLRAGSGHARQPRHAARASLCTGGQTCPFGLRPTTAKPGVCGRIDRCEKRRRGFFDTGPMIIGRVRPTLLLAPLRPEEVVSCDVRCSPEDPCWGSLVALAVPAVAAADSLDAANNGVLPDSRGDQLAVGDRRRLSRDVHAGRFCVPRDRVLSWEERGHR